MFSLESSSLTRLDAALQQLVELLAPGADGDDVLPLPRVLTRLRMCRGVQVYRCGGVGVYVGVCECMWVRVGMCRGMAGMLLGLKTTEDPRGGRGKRGREEGTGGMGG